MRKLSFPNVSRSYDARRRCVRFWAYDKSLEIPFFLAVDALNNLAPSESEEEKAILAAFDQQRTRICAAAERIYARHRQQSYLLLAGDVA
jgi:hypothetical protein